MGEEIPAIVEFPTPFVELPRAGCGTGASFETGVAAKVCDVIDMEAYALAKVCHVENSAFACAELFRQLP